MDDEQCIACNSDDIPCREHGRYDDAAIAVANEETAELREKLDDTRQRGQWYADAYLVTNRECIKAKAENARLCAELDHSAQRLALADEMHASRLATIVDEEVYNELLDRAHELADTIARVEAVADDYDKPGSYAVASRIRDALKGEQS